MAMLLLPLVFPAKNRGAALVCVWLFVSVSRVCGHVSVTYLDGLVSRDKRHLSTRARAHTHARTHTHTHTHTHTVICEDLSEQSEAADLTVSLKEIQEARARVEALETGDAHSTRAVGVCKVVTPLRYFHEPGSGAAYNILPGPCFFSLLSFSHLAFSHHLPPSSLPCYPFSLARTQPRCMPHARYDLTCLNSPPAARLRTGHAFSSPSKAVLDPAGRPTGTLERPAVRSLNAVLE